MTVEPGEGGQKLLPNTIEKIKELKDKYNANIESVYVPSLDISSTYIREQLNKHKTIKKMEKRLESHAN